MAKGTDEEDTKSSKIKELYRYDEMSNKVLKADKNLQNTQTDPLKDAELSHPKSMKGMISFKDMGSSVRQVLDINERNAAEKEVEQATDSERRQNTNKTFEKYTSTNNTLLGSSNQTNLIYYPTTDDNMEAYREVLDWVTDLLGSDMPHDIITGTADIIITTLKKDEQEYYGLTDNKRKTLESDLGIDIEESKFIEVFKIIKHITDFGVKKSLQKTEDVVTVLANSDNEDNEDEMNALEQEINMEQEISDDFIPQKKKKAASVPQIDNSDILTITSGKVILPPIANINKDYIRNILGIDGDVSISNLEKRLSDKKYDDQILKQDLKDELHITDEGVIRIIIENKAKLLWAIRLNVNENRNLQRDLENMKENGLEDLVREFQQSQEIIKARRHSDINNDVETSDFKKQKSEVEDGLSLLDLSTIKFDQGSDLMTNTKVKLPEGSFKRIKPQYDEIHIPPPAKAKIDYDLVPIRDLPNWARKAFPSGETDTLNAVQSKVFPTAFKSDHNMLLCAPTGAGKTNVAMLTVLRTLSHYHNERNDSFQLRKFKIIYIAPLKALVQEQVREFRRRLSPFDIKVAELTGDSRLSRKEIETAQILVSTPEKWDIITRKSSDNWYTDSVKLIIIDEIHLLHDERGPVLESIVARTLRSKDYTDKPRLVGLSATLPNYTDVATFLRVPEEGLFYFDSSYRPCPLSQQFCGIKSEGSLKKLNAMNQACYDKVLESLTEGNQIIVFVHSRKETGRTGEYLRAKFLESELADKLINSEAGSKEILKSESNNILDQDLKKLLTHGIGIHHAGLSREDRSMAEDMFADGLLRVLVSTATLAWGVNLPAHTVIIKGTDVYSPEQSNWVRLSPQDMLQMLGRAGRPRYDTHGDGIIITNQSDIQYYLAVLNQQLPIESQLISKIVDNLNAEVVAGNVSSLLEAVDWLTYTYFYVRILVAPDLYKVSHLNEDDTFKIFRTNLAHTVFSILSEQNLLLYNESSGAVVPTELGRIASYFYIKYETMNIYNQELSENVSIIDLFRIFTLSDEFKYFSIRPEEAKEIHELYARVPIPIKSEIDESSTKVNLLLQAFISNIKLDGFALHADMVFIQQSAGRLIKAMFELCLKKKWSKVTKLLLTLSKCIDRKMWVTNSPLRQYQKCPIEVIRKAESSNLQWNEYLSLQSPSQTGYAIRLEKYGKLIFDLIQRFPKLKMDCVTQPITPSLLKFQLEITPNWIWDESLHGSTESFLILVEDLAGSEILYSDTILIRPDAMNKEIILDFPVQLTSGQQKSMPPNIFISVISEKWLQCDEQIAVRLDSIILPKKFPAPTKLDNIQLIDTKSLNEAFGNVFHFDRFNLIQSNVFEHIYNTLSSPLASSRDFSEWMGIDKTKIFNYSSLERIEPITIHMEIEDELSYESTPRNVMNKIFAASETGNSTPIIYLPDRKTCISVATHLNSIARRRDVDIQRADEEQMQEYSKLLKDRQLALTLNYGIGFIYTNMDKKDHSIVKQLMDSGAFSFLLISKDCFDETINSSLAIICGTENYDIRDHHTKSYTANQLLEMVGNVKSKNTETGKVIIYTTTSRKPYFKKFLQEPLPTESFLYFNFHDILINGISNSIIECKQDCVDWLTYTYFYRRIHANPSFYGVKSSNEYGISAFLTELVESTLVDLSNLSMIEINENGSTDRDNDEGHTEDSIMPLNGCLISSHNNVSFITMHSFIMHSKKSSTLANLLEILASANEFEVIPLDQSDYPKLIKLQGLLPLKFKGSNDSDSTSFKVFTLLQAYFSRIELPFSLQNDLKIIMGMMTPLVNTLVDILGGNGYLNATIAMDISQMVTQAIWDVDSPLRQIPYFDENILQKCAEKRVETVYDIMALEDEDRDEILTMDNEKIMTVAKFINNYPNIEMKYTLENVKNIVPNRLNKLTVVIDRDDEPESLSVVSERFPFAKNEGWWIVVGETATRQLYALKRVSLKEEHNQYEVEFMLPETGEHSITLWCICDSYMDTDKEVTFEVNVK
ncbi:DEIH-box ATPase [Maudiozyma exigua]|uniref:DEIH-box ATPase n=1 Tax=Maudiozyma exigua TaxID=34358 RepID=A0A9P6W2N3_MAUEX|nr:DEIH-box ATPase [Kazachstania exigua]